MSNIPPAVRILPMDSKATPGFVGCSIEEVQRQFFLNELVRPDGAPGKFHSHKAGIRAEPGTVVLFQYVGKIIASAVLSDIERYPATERDRFGGAYQFDPKSIRVFDPVDAAGIRRIWPQVTRLGQAKWSLDPESYQRFERQLAGVEWSGMRSLT
jgi:hypothetical protein